MSSPSPRPLLLLRNGAYLFLTKAAPALAFLAILILYARELPLEEYGRYAAVWIRLGIFGTLAYAGVPVLLLSLSAPRIKAWLLSVRFRLKCAGFVWLAVCAIAYAVLQWQTISVAILLSIALVVLYAGTAILESAIVVSGRLAAMTWGGVVYSSLYAMIHVIILKNGYDLNLLLVAIIILQTIRLVFYAALAFPYYKALRPEPLPDPARTSRYWLHTGLYDLSINIARWADKAAVSFLLTAALSAVYFNGSLEVPFIPLLMGAAGSAVLVELSKRNHTSANAVQLVIDAARVQATVVFPIFFFLFFFREEIFSVLFAGKYAASVPVFAASLLVLPLRSYHFTVLLEAKQEGRIINTGALIDILLTLALFYPAYQIFGLPGFALAPVIGTWVQMAYYLLKTSNVYGVHATRLFPFRHWLLCILLFGSLLGCGYELSSLIEDERLRLSLAAGIAALLSFASLFLEIRRYRKRHRNSHLLRGA